MRVILQRVSKASVTIKGTIKASINKGLLLLVGIEESDNEEDIDWLVKKILQMRIFDDQNGTMNISSLDIKGDVLIISQFTLFASYKKGNRPSYIRAAGHKKAIPLYEKFCKEFENQCLGKVGTGIFGEDMKVELLNDGPVTIYLDTKNKE